MSAITVAFLPGALQAQYPAGYTLEPYLPTFCRYTQDGPPSKDVARTAEHYDYFGFDFHDVHHFCRGLYLMHEAVSDHDREASLFERAVSEFDYVLRNTATEFLMRPDVLLNKGLALRAMGDQLAAVRCFQEAVELRPYYDAGYVALAIHFESAGDVAGALDVLRLGERRGRNPDEFRRRIRELEGSGEETARSDVTGESD